MTVSPELTSDKIKSFELLTGIRRAIFQGPADGRIRPTDSFALFYSGNLLETHLQTTSLPSLVSTIESLWVSESLRLAGSQVGWTDDEALRAQYIGLHGASGFPFVLLQSGYNQYSSEPMVQLSFIPGMSINTALNIVKRNVRKLSQ